jgi:hypothetical protein
MNARNGAGAGHTRSVVRAIDRELERLEALERALTAEREVLLAARSALTRIGTRRPAPRRRVSRAEIAAYLSAHPGSSIARIAESLHVAETTLSMHLHRGKHTRYELRDDRWYVRASPG